MGYIKRFKGSASMAVQEGERMKRMGIALSVVLVAASLVTPGSAAASHSSDKAGGNAATRWVEHALASVRLQNVGTPNAGRLYAMVTVAMYDAVNGIDRARRHGREHALVAPGGAPRKGHRDIAAAAAAHRVLTALLHADQPPISDGALDAALSAELKAAQGKERERDEDGEERKRDKDNDPVAAGRSWGDHVGRQVVALRSADRTQAEEAIRACSRFNHPMFCEPGEFNTNFDARWRRMTPFGVASLTPYLSPPPPALTSDEYTAAFEDVKTCGSNSPDLDRMCADPTTPAERTEISTFWLAESGTVRETGTWFQAALSIVEKQGTAESISQTTRLFALLGMAVADSVVLAWDTKARYFTWRPTFAIHQADRDGNPDTLKDAAWTSRIGAIGGTPEYNSGTSTFAGAASAVIEGFYCHETVSFGFESDSAPNRPRFYATPLQAAEEAGRSRIFQGIHFQFSNEDGRRAGRGMGTEVVSSRLRLVGRPSAGRACP